MDKKYTHNDLAKLFGVENLVTPKTLISETDREIRKKPPHEAAEDVRILLDELNVRVHSQDIIGICSCLDAIQLRVTYMKDMANHIRKDMGL